MALLQGRLQARELNLVQTLEGNAAQMRKLRKAIDEGLGLRGSYTCHCCMQVVDIRRARVARIQLHSQLLKQSDLASAELIVVTDLTQRLQRVGPWYNRRVWRCQLRRLAHDDYAYYRGLKPCAAFQAAYVQHFEVPVAGHVLRMAPVMRLYAVWNIVHEQI